MKESQIKIINTKKSKQIKFDTQIVKKGQGQMQRIIRFPKFFSEQIISKYDEIAIIYSKEKFYIKPIEGVKNTNYVIQKINFDNTITIPRKICRQENINLDKKTCVEYTYDYNFFDTATKKYGEIYFQLK